MDLVGIRLNISGDDAKAKSYLGVAKSQLNILRNQMSFQNLKQGSRKVQLSADTWMECSSCFGHDTLKIFSMPVPVVVSEVGELTVTIYPSSLTEGGTAVITVAGGVSPYSITITPPYIGFVLPTPIAGTDNTFTFVGNYIGSAEVIATDANGLIGTTQVSVAPDPDTDTDIIEGDFHFIDTISYDQTISFDLAALVGVSGPFSGGFISVFLPWYNVAAWRVQYPYTSDWWGKWTDENDSNYLFKTAGGYLNYGEIYFRWRHPRVSGTIDATVTITSDWASYYYDAWA